MQDEQFQQIVQTVPTEFSILEVSVATGALLVAYACVKLATKLVTSKMYGNGNGRTDRRTGATADTIMTKLTSVENMVRDIHKKD